MFRRGLLPLKDHGGEEPNKQAARLVTSLVDVFQARGKSTKINLLGPETAGWGGGLPREGGGGRKVRARPRKFVFLGFQGRESGMSRTFCRDVPNPWGCSKSLCKNSLCAFFVPPSFGLGIFVFCSGPGKGEEKFETGVCGHQRGRCWVGGWAGARTQGPGGSLRGGRMGLNIFSGAEITTKQARVA